MQCIRSEEPGRLRCEAVDFAQWHGGERVMTEEMLDLLESMGYQPQPESNYAIEMPARDTAEIHRLAGFLARTLHDVYGVPANAPLEVVVDS